MLLQITNHVRLFFQDFVQVIVVPMRRNLNQSEKRKIAVREDFEMTKSLFKKSNFLREKITDKHARLSNNDSQLQTPLYLTSLRVAFYFSRLVYSSVRYQIKLSRDWLTLLIFPRLLPVIFFLQNPIV